jgi:hypothetical protein
MYCASCGTQNEDSAAFCAACGRSLPKHSAQYPAPYQPIYVQQPPAYQPVYVQRPAVPYPQVSSHMGFAILSLIIGIFTVWLLGSSIPAMVYASKVDRMISFGDIAGAQSASRAALTWCWVTLGLFLLGLVAAVIAIIAFFAAADSGSYYY